MHLLYNTLDEVPAGSHCPEFSQTLAKTIVVEGGPSRLECKLTGTPLPEVQWLVMQ